jgi:nitroreductase
MNEVINAIKNRRSVRAYKNVSIEKDVLQAIVEAGYYAPTGHNGQPWHFAVVQDGALIAEVNAETKKKMAQVPVGWIKNAAKSPRPVTHGAPVLIIVSSKKGYVTGRDDCTAALENMLIAAESLGVGSCWMGFVSFTFDDNELMARLGVPEGYEPQQAAVFGYPDGEKKEAPPRNPDVVTYTGTF